MYARNQGHVFSFCVHWHKVRASPLCPAPALPPLLHFTRSGSTSGSRCTCPPTWLSPRRSSSTRRRPSARTSSATSPQRSGPTPRWMGPGWGRRVCFRAPSLRAPTDPPVDPAYGRGDGPPAEITGTTLHQFLLSLAAFVFL